MRLKAPRILNEPVRWRFSHLMKTSPPVRSDSARDRSSGVRTATPFKRRRASSISSIDTRAVVVTSQSCHPNLVCAAPRTREHWSVNDWSPSSWRIRVARQQPEWPDADALADVEQELRSLPPLVFAGEARRAEPRRLVRSYHQSAATLNLLRALTKGGFADLSKILVWNQEFVAGSKQGQRYEAIARQIDRALRFMAACGIDLSVDSALHEVDFYTSHEALILGY